MHEHFYVISYYFVGFPLVFRWFYYLKIVGLILPMNFNFWEYFAI